ncbi:hypothetical protein GCM10007291_02790 [Gemmobacter nanjingensis]|uniref:Bacteriophage phiJL001 Gp84 C-terminal domain-containing protein n=1 Tax=Gemmobacter nanjingensis TaxID=488454 RepID=A0ABQ3F6R6_9RHOB|nr:DUF2163 domain-containing protein [Gemmobacter nanjingensis]GHC09887.1 hypothetical protein GCM10007291_02790 [Gemmobacter nanjingensis]
MSARDDLLAHLAGGATTVCRAWLVRRVDGTQMGFTDHDGDLRFGGVTFRASTGLTAGALQQSTGLSVDNTQAVGALSDAGLTEADILAGRYDGAEVEAWLVNWADPTQRDLLFRGTLGEITRNGAGFEAELRGLAERLNHPQGWVYQRECAALLGDRECGVDLQDPQFTADCVLAEVTERRVFRFAPLAEYPQGWFERGVLTLRDGAAADLSGAIKTDRILADGRREIGLWRALGADVAAGTAVRLVAGCDKRPETCRQKFNNFLNFRGFPHIPGEDWLTSFPTSSLVNDGGSLRG